MQTILVGTEPDFFERDWLESLFAPTTLDIVSSLEPSQPALVILSDSIGKNPAGVRRLLGEAAGRVPVGLIHLSDEFLASPIDFYDQATWVFRHYYRSAAAAMNHVLHTPLGYKSGFQTGLVRKRIQDRKTSWFFAGEIKGRRNEMLAAANRLPGGAAVLTQTWNDPQGLSTAEYASALADTVFALCPRGNDSVDCFRVYEALEAGAIPIVEDDGRFDPWLAPLRLPEAVRSPFEPRGRFTGRYRRLFGHGYWKSLFGEDFPLPCLHDWKRLPELIQQFGEPEHLAARTGVWWEATKLQARRQVQRALNEMGPLATASGQG